MFSDKITSNEIHKQIERRKIYSNESFMQCFLAMGEIAHHWEDVIDECFVIQYTIQGIQSVLSDKIILYGEKSHCYFKEKLWTYETKVTFHIQMMVQDIVPVRKFYIGKTQNLMLVCLIKMHIALLTEMMLNIFQNHVPILFVP